MKLKEMLTNFNFPFNNWYNSKEWYLLIRADLPRMLRTWYGNREIFDMFLDKHGDLTPAGVIEIKDAIDITLMANTWKYDHLYGIYAAEYNPIWNYDGTDVEERERKNTGTQGSTRSGDDTLEMLGSEKNEKSGNDYTMKTGSESNTRTGNETVEPTGSEKLTRDGSVVESRSGGPTNSRTTFDSAAFLDTDKTVDNGKTATTYGKDGSGATDPYTETTSFTLRKDTKTYNQVKDETSFTNRKDDTTYNSSNTRSFTGRKDKTTYNSATTRTDDLTEHETITRTRGGNQGTTTTQSMMVEELEIATRLKLLNTITLDIVNAICYS